MDSINIILFIKTFFVSGSIGKEARQFYKKRNYRLAWINKNGLTYASSTFYNQLQNYSYNFSDSSVNNRYLNSLVESSQHDEKYFFSQSNHARQLDMLLTAIFFKYARKAYGGKAQNLGGLKWFIPRQIKNYQAALDSLVLLSKGDKEQVPLNDYYFHLKKQLMSYRHIEKNGDLPIPKFSKVIFQLVIVAFS